MNSASTVFQSKEARSEQRYSNKHMYVFLQISLWYILYEIVKKKKDSESSRAIFYKVKLIFSSWRYFGSQQ